MKRLMRYKCVIENYLSEPTEAYLKYGGSFEIRYAEITAETKSEAMRMESKSVQHFKRCKIEQSVIAEVDALKSVQWLMNNREV